MKQSQDGDREGEHIVLDESGGEKSPRIDERQLWDEGQVRDDDVRVCGPLFVADGGAEDALQGEGNEHDASDGRDIYPGRHVCVGGGDGEAWSEGCLRAVLCCAVLWCDGGRR